MCPQAAALSYAWQPGRQLNSAAIGDVFGLDRHRDDFLVPVGKRA
jgi:hypothetical protein